jgi:hypothetical protein
MKKAVCWESKAARPCLPGLNSTPSPDCLSPGLLGYLPSQSPSDGVKQFIERATKVARHGNFRLENQTKERFERTPVHKSRTIVLGEAAHFTGHEKEKPSKLDSKDGDREPTGQSRASRRLPKPDYSSETRDCLKVLWPSLAGQFD